MNYMKIKKIILLLELLVLLPALAFAQNVTVQAGVDSAQRFIGQQAKLMFEIHQPKNEHVVFPAFPDSSLVNKLEVVGLIKPDTIADNNNLVVRYGYVVTAFDSALVYIPSLPFVVGSDTVASNPVAIKYYTVPVDTASHKIADIKPVYKPPFDWNRFYLFLLILLLGILLAIAVYFLIKKLQVKEKTQEESSLPVDNRPAHVIAFEQFKKIRDEKLWQKGREKQFYTEITDVLRLYIHRRYHIATLERTTEELLGDLKNLRLQKDQDVAYKTLKNVLQLSDLVKFAKWKPSLEDDERTLSNSVNFVDETKEEKNVEDNHEEKDDSAETGEVDSTNTKFD